MYTQIEHITPTGRIRFGGSCFECYLVVGHCQDCFAFD
jgi:hypothetical protein